MEFVIKKKQIGAKVRYLIGEFRQGYQCGIACGGWFFPAGYIFKTEESARAKAAELGRTVDRIITD